MPAEKSPRQPRKPFQNVGKKENTPGPDKKSAKPDKRKTGRSDSRMDKAFKPKHKEDKPAKRAFKKERPYPSREEGDRPAKRIIRKENTDKTSGKEKKYATRSGVRIDASKAVPQGIRLNKFIANSGICSRREADELIKAGVIKVNGEVISTLGSKVMPGDKVQYSDQTLSNEKKRYLLLNKQKGYVTTTKDPHAKNTVMELIAGACKERIYPVGRLDRNTTGLLLFTNDGDLARKLMHPRSRIKKMYHVVLDQPLKKSDLVKISGGIELEGERILVDSIAYVEDAPDRREVGMELHSGQNRIVRRIFESLGYKVSRLDRVMYAGLTKKSIPRGRWRFLEEKEVIFLGRL